MSATTPGSALHFRGWTSGKPEKQPLDATLARVHLERGPFRDITEASLQEEVATEGALQLSSSDDEDEEEDEDKAQDAKRQPATTREQLYQAKGQMLHHISTAHNEMLLSLQLIALMESKYNANQASVSFTKDIKDNIPIGSIGTDVWDARALPANTAREAQDKLLASKVRMESLQNSADDLLAAATRLQENVRKETVYWSELLAISEKNWRISRIPKHTLLGVHFGFNGCARAFEHRNIAALVGDAEGAVTLERGIGTKPKAIRATVKRNGRIVGASKLPALPADGETTLDARIRYARDSVFDEELFHEALRESRTLTSLGVSMSGSSLCFDTGKEDGVTVELELVSLEDNQLPLDVTHELDILAKAVLLTARLLLGQKHRDRIDRGRQLPKPMTENVEDERPFSILRPLLAMVNHHSNITVLNKHFEATAEVLRKTQIQVECQTAEMGLALPEKESTTISSLLESLCGPLTSEAMLSIIPSDGTPLKLKLNIKSSPSDVSSTFTIAQPHGNDLTFEGIADSLAAAEEVLALLFGKVLKDLAGEEWRFEPRGGALIRESKGGTVDTMWFVVDGTGKTVTLQRGYPHEQKSTVWKLDDDQDVGALKDVYKTLLE